MAEYAIVIEDDRTNYPVYVPDLPGCVATGGSVEVTENVRAATTLHVASLREHGEEVPARHRGRALSRSPDSTPLPGGGPSFEPPELDFSTPRSLERKGWGGGAVIRMRS